MKYKMVRAMCKWYFRCGVLFGLQSRFHIPKAAHWVDATIDSVFEQVMSETDEGVA